MSSHFISVIFIFLTLSYLSACSQESDIIQNSSIINSSKAVSISGSLTGVTKIGQMTYDVPKGHQVTTEYNVTVDSGVIAGVSISMISGDHESQRYHDSFAQKIQAKAIGKKISELSLHAIGGASLTTAAFEQFISQEFAQ